MKYNIVTIFPHLISGYGGESILKRGQNSGAIEICPLDLRVFTQDKHNKVDDTPYGGGAGMVMQVEPIFRALKSIDAIPFSKVDGLTKVKKVFNGSLARKKRTILMSPRGRQFDQSVAEQWSHLDELTIICGRYEGIDQRVVDHLIDEEISIGPYVLAGGELGAMVIIEAVSRLIPGVLGNAESLKDETHNVLVEDGGVESEYPHYTKPADFKGWKVPDVLLSGDHKKIEEWRMEQSKKK
ncbi:MAG: tRNA (guanosine(37)-N1)-methyltransferase TrmD [Candidatus Magasanikbacteria bacterium CG11_big_fil_rev_8_21_14_0_20_39_34]|uniref:tRNA (guanine-N(1)-)-methyltransferase n=1 Tax=Candidatus Magasanikbacteria bacterium CG11_big_fil_rev_8_21_14_0_20_39_34 TaxID=1974653 RepID=A0A2H0N3R6_9BACT|nr:MAG: tRNA (guanosine(37)-N1)-methyltransferase TrmD [Candidatus Magasanikbacteria bacterium CG11_big_fil_rev_8_21_14_0_20_39_34]